jgi:hypothetical protein
MGTWLRVGMVARGFETIDAGRRAAGQAGH